MEDYDAFSAGVEVGGLRSRNEIKTLICYLLNTLDKPLTKEQLTEIIQEKAIANYFDVSQSLDDLIKNGTVVVTFDEDGNEYLSVTEDRKNAVNELKGDLPRTIREEAVNAGIQVVTRARHAQETKTEIKERPDGGCDVTLMIVERGDILMSLTLYAADFAQATAIKKRFLNDPVKLYSGIVTSLTT
ncbi:MAG: DUF4364 family protein [Clostridiales bacterium]|nr:DUF4364 family protein [Clostridiales bacterium]